MLLITLLLPLNSAEAEATEPLTVQMVRIDTSRTGGQTLTVEDGATVPAGSYRFHLAFSVNNVYPQHGAATLTGSDGTVIKLESSYYMNEVLFYLKETAALKKSTTYTLRVKGGADGVTHPNYLPMAEDFLFTFKTDSSSRYTHVRPNETYGTVPPIGGMRMKMSKGRLTMDFSTDSFDYSPKDMTVTISDAVTGQVVDSESFTVDGQQRFFDIPKTGDYLFEYTSVRTGYEYQWHLSFELRGTDLEAYDSYIPIAKTAQNKPYITYRTAQDVTKYFLYFKPLDQAMLFVDGKLLRQNVLTAQNTVSAVTIDPKSLPDGLHAVQLIFTAETSDNYGGTYQMIAVDHAQSFKDVTRAYWGSKAIETMHSIGIVNGRKPGSFEPESNISRAEFATMLAKTFGAGGMFEASYGFADISKHWAKPYINMLAYAGVLKGEVDAYGVRRFYPDRPISRAEAAVMLGTAIGYPSSSYVIPPIYFDDARDVPNWAYYQVAYLRLDNIITGDNGKFYPKRNMSRAEAAALLFKVIEEQPDGRPPLD